MAYATPEELLIRYDARRVADLVSDTGTRTTDPASSPVVAACLEDASGMVESACRVAGRYTINQLVNLQGHTRFLLTRLVCDLTYGLLVARRGYSANDMNTMAPQYKGALDMLEQIKQGDRIFDYPGTDTHNPDAGSSCGCSSCTSEIDYGSGPLIYGTCEANGASCSGCASCAGRSGPSEPVYTAAEAGYKVIGMKTYTQGVHTGLDLVGRSRRLWGQRNMT